MSFLSSRKNSIRRYNSCKEQGICVHCRKNKAGAGVQCSGCVKRGKEKRDLKKKVLNIS